MGLLDLLLVAVGLSMDAFAVSVCKGLNTKMHPVKTGLVAGLYFGGFQALMPTLGTVLVNDFQRVDAVAQALGHLAALAVADDAVDLERTKGN